MRTTRAGSPFVRRFAFRGMDDDGSVNKWCGMATTASARSTNNTHTRAQLKTSPKRAAHEEKSKTSGGGERPTARLATLLAGNQVHMQVFHRASKKYQRTNTVLIHFLFRIQLSMRALCINAWKSSGSTCKVSE